jgi:hypothetical protein
MAGSGRPLASRPPPLAFGVACTGPSQNQPHHPWNRTAVLAPSLFIDVHSIQMSLPRVKPIRPVSCFWRSTMSKVEEKSSTTFSFSLSPGFLSFLREKFSPFLYGEFKKKEQNTFLFLFLRVFSIFLREKFSLFSSTLSMRVSCIQCLVLPAHQGE